MRQGSGSFASRSDSPSYSTGALEFEYNGSGELRVIGQMTGAVYTFNGNGARAIAQAADAASLALVPGLRPIR